MTTRDAHSAPMEGAPETTETDFGGFGRRSYMPPMGLEPHFGGFEGTLDEPPTPSSRWLEQLKGRQGSTTETPEIVPEGSGQNDLPGEGLNALKAQVPDWPVTAMNEQGVRPEVRSRLFGFAFWTVSDGDPGPGDGLPVFSVVEVIRLWAQGRRHEELVHTVMDEKGAFSVVSVEGVRRDG